MSALSILVVTSTPDHRNSTAELDALITELRRRPGVTVHVWFLRPGESPPWQDSRVVDDLRTLPVPAAIDKLGLSPVAGAIRGRILRRWWTEVAPDVVVLDDALGERLLPDDRSAVVVHRMNPDAPGDAALEARATTAADIQLVPLEGSPSEAPTGLVVLDTLARTDMERARPFASASSRTIVRRRLGVPTDGVLVVGWGEHAWFDGPDIFVRALWNLRERHGIDAHGMWAGSDDDGEVAAVLQDEAERCALVDHISHRPQSPIDVRLCGDAVFLPYRDGGSIELVHEAAVAGCQVVSFPVWQATSPGLRLVDYLDVEAATAALAASVGADEEARAAYRASASARLDIAPFVDDLLDAVSQASTRR